MAERATVVDTAKMRRPAFASGTSEPSGCVTRDDRGNAVWQWSRDSEALPPQANHPGLSVADDAPSPTDSLKSNKVAARSGYDPYQSGLIEKAKRANRLDLRELSRRIEFQKKKRNEDTET
jgi:hypothetical protein